MARRPPYPPEFRARILEIVRNGRTPEDLATEFEPTSLRDPDAVSERSLIYTETFQPNGPSPYDEHHRMITDGDWKLIRVERLYLLDDWDDGPDLLSTGVLDDDAAVAHTPVRGAG